MKARSLAMSALVSAVALTSTGGAQTLDRSKVPTLGPPPKVSLPPIVTRELPNGLKLLIVEQHELPLVDFALVVGSGGTNLAAAQQVNHPGKPKQVFTGLLNQTGVRMAAR